MAASTAPVFLDTTVLLYLVSRDAAKADRAEALLMRGAVVNVQVLNEFASVARRKASMSWDEIEEVLALLCQRCKVRPMTVSVHEQALALVRRFSLAWYDAMLVAAAADAGCATLFSEALPDGLAVSERLTIRNPFELA